jgi:antitoxin CptB
MHKDEQTDEQNAITRKRLAWRASHRGIKEMDLLIGGFANRRLETMGTEDLALFETILDFADQDLLAWVTGQEAVPAQNASALLQDMLNFRPNLET